VSDRADLWRAAAAAAREGREAALATVARRRGSLPMASDAKMLVEPNGRRLGTIGGGCLEADVTGQALETIGRGGPALVRHTLNADVAGDLGLSCGGTVELFLEPVVVGDEAAALYAAAAAAIDTRTCATVLTPLDWADGPRKTLQVGSQLRTIGVAVAPIAPVAPVVQVEAGLLVEPLPRVPRLLLFGAGHVAAEIARAAAATDFHVVVVDDREEFANRDRFPTAVEVIVRDLPGVLAALTLDPDDYVIACTRGHALDAVVIEATAASAACYVGMLGSRRKREVIWKALERSGVPRDALERVKVPIGEEIGADTPGEIGISVMAELIRVRRLGGVGGGAPGGSSRPERRG
jgi:xanthine dehydrogenase accessory factor